MPAEVTVSLRRYGAPDSLSLQDTERFNLAYVASVCDIANDKNRWHSPSSFLKPGCVNGQDQ